MAVTVPDGVGPGSIIQVAGPQSAPTITTGVPVMPSGPEGQGVPVTVGMVEPGVEVHAQQQMQFVETDEISPAGWFCLIVGCIFCPPFNLIGCCMRERRLVPVQQYHAFQ